MTNEIAAVIERELRARAGECWSVDVLREAGSDFWEIRIHPKYFGCICITEDMMHSADYMKTLIGQLDTMRDQMVAALEASLPND